MEVSPVPADLTLLYIDEHRFLHGFSRVRLTHIPFLTSEFQRLIAGLLAEIETSKGFFLAFSTVPIILFAAVEIALLISVYFNAILIVFFWVTLLVFFYYLNRKKQKVKAVLARAGTACARVSAQTGGLLTFELAVSHRAFFGIVQAAVFKVSMKTSLINGIQGKNNVEAAVGLVEGEQSGKKYAVDLSKVKEYDSMSESSSKKALSSRTLIRIAKVEEDGSVKKQGLSPRAGQQSTVREELESPAVGLNTV